MANSNSPFGLSLLGSSGGGVPATMAFDGPARKIASSAAAIFNGDPVLNLNTGYVSKWVNGTAVSQLAGIFRGCKYYNTAIQRVVWSPYWPGSGATGDVTAYIEPIMNAAEMQYVVQVSGAALDFSKIGRNYDVVMGSGNTTTGQSTTALDSAQATTTTSTLPFRMVGVWSAIGAPNSLGVDDSNNYNWVIVVPNIAQSTGVA